jgi:hypothetical protein
VSFDSRHFVTRVITLFTSGIRIFDAVSVNNEQTGWWGPQIPLTNFLYEPELDLFQEARTSSKRWFAPDSKIFMNGSPLRQITWQHSPLTTTFEEIKNTTEHVIEVDGSGSGGLPKRF